MHEGSNLLMDTLLGKATIELAHFKGNKTKHSEWIELGRRANNKAPAEVCVELLLAEHTRQPTAPAAAGGRKPGKTAAESAVCMYM